MGSVFSNTVFSRVKDGGGVGRLGEGWARVAGPGCGEPMGSSLAEVACGCDGVVWLKTDCSCICNERAVAAVGCRKA